MTVPADQPEWFERVLQMEQRLSAQLSEIRTRLDALERRLDHRTAEIRAKQEEDLVLLKAVSCQLRGRVERVERRAARGSV